MMEGVNVLSLFDGISCGRVAFDRAAIPVANYWASEIHRPSIKCSKSNWPEIHHLGDVRKVSALELPKLHFVIGGSPCQGFSFAGKMLNFTDPRSVLFFEFVRVLEEARRVNPDVKFLLENVPMKREWRKIISERLGAEPVMIDSAMVSAQNRERWYWTNINAAPFDLFGAVRANIPQPTNLGITLADVLEAEVDEKLFLSASSIQKNYQLRPGLDLEALPRIGAVKFGRTEEAKAIRRQHIRDTGKDYTPFAKKEIVNVDDKKMNCITAAEAKDNIVFIRQRGRGKNKGGDHFRKSPTITANHWNTNHTVCGFRRLSRTEMERLQTLPDGYTKAISYSAASEAIGNGWTVDVIAHILRQWKP